MCSVRTTYRLLCRARPCSLPLCPAGGRGIRQVVEGMVGINRSEGSGWGFPTAFLEGVLGTPMMSMGRLSWESAALPLPLCPEHGLCDVP